ncbi:hypothetical protein SCHPADRAFT_936539 [Schizopora paradoxa]|uniref:Pkr1-domain-containing protein n=1 Tax=Schizopora paradoxa TaxID=27342 RepID=A0A0H2S172_9AGAM|nr:hypothetical protein SCHPADRAFT_936539 [Schizopora paradoxa]
MPDDVQNDEVDTNQHETSFFATLLTPGSSLHPTFLLILDVAFAFLLGIFLALVWLTSGSIHIFVLIGIELCLWASVKWFVKELAVVQKQEQKTIDTKLQGEATTKEKIQ